MLWNSSFPYYTHLNGFHSVFQVTFNTEISLIHNLNFPSLCGITYVLFIACVALIVGIMLEAIDFLPFMVMLLSLLALLSAIFLMMAYGSNVMMLSMALLEVLGVTTTWQQVAAIIRAERVNRFGCLQNQTFRKDTPWEKTLGN